MKKLIGLLSILTILVLVIGPVAALPAGEARASSSDAPPLQVDYDYNIYLRSRVIPDPGISESCLNQVQAATEPTHVIVQLNSLPQADSVVSPPSFPREIYLPYIVLNHSAPAGSGTGIGDLGALEALGIKLLNYLNGISGPGTAYFASVPSTLDAEDETFRELVRGLICIEPEDKIQASLTAEPANTQPVPVIVQFFNDVTREEAEGLISALGLDAQPYALPTMWQTSATPSEIQAIADQDIVQWIEFGPIPFLPTLNDVRAAHNVDAVQGLNPATGAYSGLTGSGVQVGIMDSGVDDHHNDFAGRIIRSQHGGDDHGTHVASIAAGSGVQSNQKDDAGNLNPGTAFQWRGMAPQAGIAAYGSALGNAGIYNDAINNFGVDVTNHSYILQVQGLYDAVVTSVDTIVRGDSAGVPARPIVWSAANNASQGPRDIDDPPDGITDCVRPQYPSGCPAAYQVGYFSILGPCKNCISVGSVNKNSLVHAFDSSMGPTMDGRLKPDVAAIGVGVTAAGADTDSAGNPTTGNNYRPKSGTSMATPAVTGIIALILQQYVQTFGVNLDVAPPLPSTLKAILIQTATDLAGTDTYVNPDTGAQVTYGAGPDWATGYGLVDAEAAVQLVEERRFVEDQLSTTDVTDEFILSVIPGQTEVRVTLAWDDIAGTPNANAAAAQLVNDLDLTVIDANGVLHRPLVLPLLTPNDCDGDNTNGVQVGTCAGLDPPGQNYFGPAAEGVDRRNNVEQVVVQDLGGLTPGHWTVRVSVLNDDGATVRLPLGGSQAYSLAGVTAQRADLRISKQDAPDPVVAGDQLVYTIALTNDGPDTATDVKLVDTLPGEVSHLSHTASCGQFPIGTLICDLGDLVAGGSTQFDVTVLVDPGVVCDAGGPTTITNAVEAFGTNPDPDLTDNTALEDTLVNAETDLEIAKSDFPDPAVAGEQLEYTLQVTNHGPSSACGVQVVDTLPAGVTYVGSDAGCVEGPVGTLTCNLGGVLVNEARQVSIDVLIDTDLVYNAGGPTTITNQASVASTITSDPDPSNDTATEDTLVIAAADLEILSFEAVDPPAQVLVGEPLDITLRKIITNNGPSSPMDVELTRTAAAPPDSTVTPVLSVAQEMALGLGERRVVDEVFTIECGAASHHMFTFTNEIRPLNPEDTDPDLSNNTAQHTLDIECVVPVAIDIRPEQINLNGNGVVPVLVFDNEAGEYGLPLAFDASTIDPLSVRFGPRDVTWFETGGAAEAHDRGHGHGQGLMLHFVASESELQTGDTEACVKGKWTDAGGTTHRFFGCDMVTVR